MKEHPRIPPQLEKGLKRAVDVIKREIRGKRAWRWKLLIAENTSKAEERVGGGKWNEMAFKVAVMEC